MTLLGLPVCSIFKISRCRAVNFALPDAWCAFCGLTPDSVEPSESCACCSCANVSSAERKCFNNSAEPVVLLTAQYMPLDVQRSTKLGSSNAVQTITGTPAAR